MCKSLSISLPKRLTVICKQVEVILLVFCKQVEINYLALQPPSLTSYTCLM